MMHLPASVRVYLCLTPCDMRKSFDSLQALVRDYLELDPFAGHFVRLGKQAAGPGESVVLGSRRLRAVEQTVRRGNLRSAGGRIAGASAARGHEAGVGSVVKRHRSGECGAAEAV
jgi:hypothetical protein